MSQIPVPVFPAPPQVYPQSNFAIQATTLKVGVDKMGNPKTIPVNLVALQFVYLAYSTWSVAMTTQLAGRMDAIRGFFVDNTNCANDVIIVNITFGFQVRVPARSSGFYPFLAPPGDLTFYLYNTGGTSATDSSNVYALDTTPDPANYPEYQRVLNYGVGATGSFVPIYGSTDIHGNPVPQIVANKVVTQSIITHSSIPNTNTPGTNNYIASNNWYVESFYAYFLSNGATTSYVPFGFRLYDGTVLIYEAMTEIGGGGQSTPPFYPLGNIKYQSLGTGNLFVCTYNPVNSIYTGFSIVCSY